MTCKIIADSINSYYDRLVTFLVYVPYFYIGEFKKNYINMSYIEIYDNNYIFFENEDEQQQWELAKINLSYIKNNPIDRLFRLHKVFLTSSKWNLFFNDIYNRSDKFEKFFIDLIEKMDNAFQETTPKNTLKVNEFHLHNAIAKYTTISLESKLKLYFHYLATGMPIKSSDIEIANMTFGSCWKPSNQNIYNHIAKVGDHYTYLNNGLLDITWDDKRQDFASGYNNIYRTYLCWYDVLMSEWRLQKAKNNIDFSFSK